MHPYDYQLHQKVLKHFIYIEDGGAIQSEVVPGINHVIVVRFVHNCNPDSASSTRLQGFNGLGIHPYNYPLHWKVLKHFINI